MVTTLTGKFDSFAGSMESSSEDFSNAQISFTADIASINTGNTDRDGHLKSYDFFNAEQFPKLTLKTYLQIKETTMTSRNLIKVSTMGGDAYRSEPAFPTRPGDQGRLFLR